MKVLKYLMVGVLLVCSASAVFTGCGNTEESGKKPDTPTDVVENPYANVTNLIENNCYYLGDFESLKQCKDVTVCSGMRASQNTDKEYVTHGQQSLKIEIEGMNPGWSERESDPVIIMQSGYYYQRNDFSDCVQFEVDVYNAQNENVLFWLEIRSDVYSGFAQTIKPGWNTVIVETYKMNYDYKGDAINNPELMNPDHSYLNDIREIRFKFPRYSGYTQVYYIDAVRAVKA